jgi:hypothetical protein
MFINGIYIMNRADHERATGWKDPSGAVHYDAPKAVTGADGKATGIAFDPFTHSPKELAKNYDTDIWRDAYEAAGIDMDNVDKMAKQYDKIEKYEEKISDLKSKIADTDDEKKIAKYEKKIQKLEGKIADRNEKIDKLDGGVSAGYEKTEPTLMQGDGDWGTSEQ